MSIEVRDVVKKYNSQKALDQVSFSIRAGEIVGFIGPNGAGKSTMMKIICGYLPPTKGNVFVNDLDIRSDSLSIKKMIGYLPENNPLYDDLYIKEYLEFSGGIYGIKTDLKKRVEEVIEKTGLEKEQSKKIAELSKGYKQRVGIAQALLHDPEILILDEPTTGLDPNQIVEIRNLISEVGKNKTVMLSTHIMQEVEAICDRVIIIRNGQIVANDKLKELGKDQVVFFTVSVEFNSEVDRTELLKIEGVSEVKNISEKNWILINKENLDIRNNIFNFAVKKGISVLSMQKVEKNLEDFFQELTKK